MINVSPNWSVSSWISHEVPVKTSSLYVLHDGDQAALEASHESHIIFQQKHLLLSFLHHLGGNVVTNTVHWQWPNAHPVLRYECVSVWCDIPVSRRCNDWGNIQSLPLSGHVQNMGLCNWGACQCPVPATEKCSELCERGETEEERERGRPLVWKNMLNGYSAMPS